MIAQWNKANKADKDSKDAAKNEDDGEDEAKPSPKKKRKTTASASAATEDEDKDSDMPQASVPKAIQHQFECMSEAAKMHSEAHKSARAALFSMVNAYPALRKQQW